MAEGITLKQWAKWLEKNKNSTWHLTSWSKSPKTARIKYFDLGFDTRDMRIYLIKARGSFDKEIKVHVGDDNSGLPEQFRKFPHLEGKKNTLLDLLDDLIQRELTLEV